RAFPLAAAPGLLAPARSTRASKIPKAWEPWESKRALRGRAVPPEPAQQVEPRGVQSALELLAVWKARPGSVLSQQGLRSFCPTILARAISSALPRRLALLELRLRRHFPAYEFPRSPWWLR